MREGSRTITVSASRSILPSSAFGTFSRREKAKAAEQALRMAVAAAIARKAGWPRRASTYFADDFSSTGLSMSSIDLSMLAYL